MARRGIQLSRSEIRRANHLHIGGFRIRVDVVDTHGGVPPEIFVYRRNPPNPHTGRREDIFQTVASFVDLSEFPAGAPGPDSPFFRLPYIELDVRSTKHYDEVWRTIQDLTVNLVAAMDRAEELVVAETVWCGQPAGESDSL